MQIFSLGFFFTFQIIAPQFKHFQKLRDFVEIRLPPGFPVKVDIPVLPTVSARVTFHDFAWKNTKDNPPPALAKQAPSSPLTPTHSAMATAASLPTLSAAAAATNGKEESRNGGGSVNNR